MNKNKLKYFGFACIALLFLILLFMTFFFKFSDDAIVQSSLINVESKISGKIVELNLHNNQEVQKGEILAQIDSSKYKKQIAKLSEQLNELKIQNNLALKELHDISALTEESKEQVENALEQLENANNDIVIYKNALKDGSVTNHDYKKAVKNLEVAKTNYDELQEELKNNAILFDRLSSQNISQEEEIKNLTEKLKQAELNLTYATITAPFDGVVVNVDVQPLKEVQNNVRLASIVPKKCYISANFKTSQLFKIKKGQKAKIFVENNALNGQVEEVVSVGDKTTTVKISFSQDELNKEVLSGMKARVVVRLF